MSFICTAFFISSFSLVNVCVWEPYKLFEGVSGGGESGGAVGVSSLVVGDTDRADGPKRNESLGESGGVDGAGGMPIKPFGLSGGVRLGCAVGCWNGSRNFPDGGGQNGVAGEGPNCGRGGWGPDDGGRGGDGGGHKLKWSSSPFESGLFFNLSKMALRLQ